MRNYWKHFSGSTVFAVVALSCAFLLGWWPGHSFEKGFAFFFTALMLGVLETSLSFDNAVVNARILVRMSTFWRKMYLYVGILISVFGMRILFPLLIVWLVSGLGFGEVVAMTWLDPVRFQNLLVNQHALIAGFGGGFLWMVFGSFFFDEEKEVHWIRGVESQMGRWGALPALPVLVTVVATLVCHAFVAAPHSEGFIVAALLGMASYLVVSGIGALVQAEAPVVAGAAGMGLFFFVELQDASFSFDGVIGAFAITNNLFLIALGLGIGAFFVRSMTLKLVDDQTLTELRYLEHGAFWAIGALAVILYLGAIGIQLPEVVSGCVGLVFIGLSVAMSLHFRRSARAENLGTGPKETASR